MAAKGEIIEIDMAIINKTQETLGKIISKPELTQKLLNRPPFRFLHDIIMVVIKKTGLMHGLYTELESNADNCKEKEAKMIFLQKAIEYLSLTVGKSFHIKASKVLSGMEAEKTNELLQALAEAVNNKISPAANDELVQKALRNLQKSPSHNKKPTATESPERSKKVEKSLSKKSSKSDDVKSKDTAKKGVTAKSSKGNTSDESEKEAKKVVKKAPKISASEMTEKDLKKMKKSSSRASVADHPDKPTKHHRTRKMSESSDESHKGGNVRKLRNRSTSSNESDKDAKQSKHKQSSKAVGKKEKDHMMSSDTEGDSESTLKSPGKEVLKKKSMSKAKAKYPSVNERGLEAVRDSLQPPIPEGSLDKTMPDSIRDVLNAVDSAMSKPEDVAIPVTELKMTNNRASELKTDNNNNDEQMGSNHPLSPVVIVQSAELVTADKGDSKEALVPTQTVMERPSSESVGKGDAGEELLQLPDSPRLRTTKVATNALRDLAASANFFDVEAPQDIRTAVSLHLDLPKPNSASLHMSEESMAIRKESQKSLTSKNAGDLHEHRPATRTVSKSHEVLRTPTPGVSKEDRLMSRYGSRPGAVTKDNKAETTKSSTSVSITDGRHLGKPEKTESTKSLTKENKEDMTSLPPAKPKKSDVKLKAMNREEHVEVKTEKSDTAFKYNDRQESTDVTRAVMKPEKQESTDVTRAVVKEKQDAAMKHGEVDDTAVITVKGDKVEMSYSRQGVKMEPVKSVMKDERVEVATRVRPKSAYKKEKHAEGNGDVRVHDRLVHDEEWKEQMSTSDPTKHVSQQFVKLNAKNSRLDLSKVPDVASSKQLPVEDTFFEEQSVRKMIRPGSARPTAVRKVSSFIEPVDDTLIVNVPNVIIDRHCDADNEDDDAFITKDSHDDLLDSEITEPLRIHEHYGEEGDTHGRLVKRILETKKKKVPTATLR